MNYPETLDYLFSQLPVFQRIGQAAYKANLDNTHALDTYFGHPHRKFKTIHVAGTNGKGSVSHMLAAILNQAGYKTGLYTSPHLRDFRERIRIDGTMISEEFVVDFVAEHQLFFEQIKPSFFEMTVALAFHYFAEQKIDVAIVEVGMGGRLDSTNIISPDLCVITNIGLDHTQFLGNTLPEIAREKAGIIKSEIPVVVGETHPETKAVFTETAQKNKAPLLFADSIFTTEYALQTTDNKMSVHITQNGTPVYKDLALDLQGIYQKKNICTVLASVEILQKMGYSIDESSLYNAVGNTVSLTGLKGRWQTLAYNPLTICDTGHNYDGIQLILEQIQSIAYKKLHFILGMVSDKSIDSILDLLPKEATYYFTQAKIPRALNADELAQKAAAKNLHGIVCPDVQEALQKARENADVHDLVFVGGSTFVVAEVV